MAPGADVLFQRDAGTGAVKRGRAGARGPPGSGVLGRGLLAGVERLRLGTEILTTAVSYLFIERRGFFFHSTICFEGRREVRRVLNLKK